MKIRDADILIIPGYKNSGPDHWQSRWQAKMANARRIEQDAWSKPVREEWVARLRAGIETCTRPAVLIAHSLGAATAVHAITGPGGEAAAQKTAGAFLVAPPDVENPAIRPRHLMTFGPYPQAPLPCPSFVLASRNDPFGSYQKAAEAAAAWGAHLVDAGRCGHIDDSSGHGPWPEGMMVFARFMNRLSIT